jgi:hypothetical protein
LAQTQPGNQPYSDTKPQTTRPPMESTASTEFTLAKLDRNGDGFVDKQEARTSSTLAPIFDQADTNKDGRLDAAELGAAAKLQKLK